DHLETSTSMRSSFSPSSLASEPLPFSSAFKRWSLVSLNASKASICLSIAPLISRKVLIAHVPFSMRLSGESRRADLVRVTVDRLEQLGFVVTLDIACIPQSRLAQRPAVHLIVEYFGR